MQSSYFARIELPHVKNILVVCDLALCLCIQFVPGLVSTEEVAKDHSLENSLFVIQFVIAVLLILREIYVILLLFTRSVNITNFSEKIPVKRG